jgi:hypothetical protein
MSPMELIKKAFGVFKKKSAPPPKAADAPFEHDDNVVLVFGHSNAGKTVYFSVLYELLKGNADFKLSPLDNETAANLIENYNLMRGKLLRIKEGRQVEIEGERKFPTMTSETRILKFGLDMSIRKGVKFYTVDYKGETLSIAQPGELRKQFSKFFPFARAALFFLDASVLDTDVLLREQIAAFQTILHDLRDCVPKRLPVGIVITKADFLDGFSPANPVELLPSGAAVYKGRRKDNFISGLTKVNSGRFGEVWTKTTERIARTLGNLIDSVSAYTLDFQVFFVSATGGMGKTTTGDVEPPRDITPSGVADPLMWGFRRIMFNKRKAFWRYLVKWAFALSLMWVTGFSLFNIYHQYSLYDVLGHAETKLADELRSSNGKFAQTQADNIKQKYTSYLDKMPVSAFLGANPLVEFAKQRQQFIQSRVSFEKTEQEKREPPKPNYDEKTKAAVDDFKRLKDSVATLPAAEKQAALEAGIAKLLQTYPKDSLDAGFVKQVEAAPAQLKAGIAAAQVQPFQITLSLENLRSKCKVQIQIGDDPPVDFSNLMGDNPKVEKPVSGVGNASVKAKFFDLSQSSTGETPVQQIDNPVETFYPKLGEGYTLDFGKDYGIVVKLKSGTPPKLP